MFRTTLRRFLRSGTTSTTKYGQRYFFQLVSLGPSQVPLHTIAAATFSSSSSSSSQVLLDHIHLVTKKESISFWVISYHLTFHPQVISYYYIFHPQVIVLERNRRIAKAYARAPVLTVNGTEDGFDGFRCKYKYKYSQCHGFSKPYKM